MPTRVSFDYAIIRAVPRVERGEFVNAGVIVFCLSQRFLRAQVGIDECRLRALYPTVEVDVLTEHLDAFVRVCAGEPDAGAIAALSLRERFHWLVSPRSTMVQISPVHSGLCESPEVAISELFDRFVRV